MNALETTVTKSGNSLVITVPKEVCHVLGVGQGVQMLWVPSHGGYRVTPKTKELEQDLELFEKLNKKLGPVMKGLVDYDQEK